jgi:hypothetical protein
VGQRAQDGKRLTSQDAHRAGTECTRSDHRTSAARHHLATFIADLLTISILICLAAICVRAMRIADHPAELVVLAIMALGLGAAALWMLGDER